MPAEIEVRVLELRRLVSGRVIQKELDLLHPSAWPAEYVNPEPDQSPAELRDPRLPERDRNR